MAVSGEAIRLELDAIGQRYGELRLCKPLAVAQMEASLRRHGQIAPVVVCPTDQGGFELIDGFKRLGAARAITNFGSLQAHVLPIGMRAAKAALLQLNWLARPVSDLEEALVVRSLCRDDGLSQVEVGVLIGRGPSWVSRRLTLVERLSEELQQDLRLGLLRPTEARELARLPRGTQPEALASCRDLDLSSREVARLCRLWLESSPRQRAQLLSDPNAALRPSSGLAPKDERLSAAAQSCQRALTDLTVVCQRVLQLWSPPQLSGLVAAEWLILAPQIEQARQSTTSVLQWLQQAESKPR